MMTMLDNQFDFLAEGATLGADIVRIEAGAFTALGALEGIDAGALVVSVSAAPIWLNLLSVDASEIVPEDQMAFADMGVAEDWIEPMAMEVDLPADVMADDLSVTDGADGFDFYDAFPAEAMAVEAAAAAAAAEVVAV